MKTDAVITAAVPEESNEQCIARLAALPTLDYERCRETEAERLGARLSVLDDEVAKVRPHAAADALQGRAFTPHDTRPWPGAVDGAETLTDIASAVGSHVSLSPAETDAVALWVVHTHAHEAADVSAILAITSAAPECGKTTLIGTLTLLVPRSLAASNVTSATVFRAVEMWRPTLLIDEADSFLDENEELRGVLNSGHARTTAFILRTVGDDHEPRRFGTWAPKAIALIGKLPATLESRSIHIELQRATPAERVTPLSQKSRAHLEVLARKAARYAADHMSVLRSAEPTMPTGFAGRRADNWRPLLSIADLAGGNWPERARAAAVALTQKNAGQTHGVALLSDIREIFAVAGVDRIASGNLARQLGEMESRPWPEWSRGKPITQVQLSRLLAPFRIRPDSIRIGDDTPKGYLAAWCQDAFARYLPEPSATPQQPNKTGPSAETASATAGTNVADQDLPQPADSLPCCGVADQTPGDWEDAL